MQALATRSNRIVASLCMSSLVLSATFVISSPAIGASKKKKSTDPVPPVAKAQVGLRDLGYSAKLLERATLDLISEVERTDVYFGTGLEDIGSIVTPQIEYPNPDQGDILSPRKRWVTYNCKQIGQTMDLVNADIAAADLPDDASSDATASISQMKDLMKDVGTHYKKLQDIVAGPKLDNLAIGKEALAIYDNVTKVEVLNKKLAHMVRTDAHTAAAQKSSNK